jgi:hemolysin activation/secretion protein
VGAGNWQLGVAQSAMQYRLGKNFAMLDAHGSASDTTLYALATIHRRRSAELHLIFSLDHKRFDDDANGATALKRADVAALSLGGRWLQPAGVTSATVGLAAGRLHLGISQADLDAQGHGTAGGYAKLSLQGSHERNVAPGLRLSLRGSAQWSACNLDSSEKLDLGGPHAVRAYPSGQSSSDAAAVLNAELIRDFGRWRGKVFGDYARGRAWHRPLPNDVRNRKEVHGVGVGFDADLAEGLVLKAVLAARTSRPGVGDVDRAVRAWFQLAKTF